MQDKVLASSQRGRFSVSLSGGDAPVTHRHCVAVAPSRRSIQALKGRNNIAQGVGPVF